MATKTTKTTKAATPAAEKKAAKAALTMTFSPSQPQANFQFTVEVDGLESSQPALLEMTNPGGALSTFTVQASPEGKAQFLILAREEGPHTLAVSADGKHGAEETLEILP